MDEALVQEKENTASIAVGVIQEDKSPNIIVRTSRNTMDSFQKEKIVASLMKETSIDETSARMIASELEQEVSKLHLKYITAPLIREIVNVKLLEHGFESARMMYTRLGMPVYDARQLIFGGSKENANLQHNPETVHKLMADVVSKEYSLVSLLPPHLVDAHMKGDIHIHDLDYFATRPFCFSHDLRFFLKNGLKVDGTGKHTSIAGPAKRPEVAFLHAAKALAASQTNCAGGQGFSFFNTFLAPQVEGLDLKHVKQMAQMFIYEMSQMYVARGGQTVFSSIDMDIGIPKKFRDVPAVQLGGVVEDSVTYADYEDESRLLFDAFVDVYYNGDYQGKPFNFPKFEVQIRPNEMKHQEDALLKVAALSAKFGTPYYIINQPYMPEFACYQCCSYLMPLNDANTDTDVINGTIRGGALQVVTINLPKAAYDSMGNDERLLEIIRERMELAKEVLLLKREIVHKNLKSGLLPFMQQSVDGNGTPYLIPDKQSFVIGMVGMNELLKAHTGMELHESPTAWTLGLKVMNFMRKTVEEFRKQTGLNFSLARTPAESTAYRFASIDLKNYGERAVVQGNTVLGEGVYYTNAFHVRPSADISLFKRLEIEGAFHPLTTGGAMSHVWLGEANPDPVALHELTKKIATKTAVQYFAYTKDFSICPKCDKVAPGLENSCPSCSSTEMIWWSRITGYYQSVSGWNKGKVAELRDRKRYGLGGM